MSDSGYILPGRAARNPLLVRAEVGKVRRATMQLPAEGYIYGHAVQREAEGAKEAIHSWASEDSPAVARRRRRQARKKHRAKTPAGGFGVTGPPGESIRDIVENEYQRKYVEDTTQALKKKKGRGARPAPTKASEARVKVLQARRERAVAAGEEEGTKPKRFVLKRFRDVKPRIQMPGGRGRGGGGGGGGAQEEQAAEEEEAEAPEEEEEDDDDDLSI